MRILLRYVMEFLLTMPTLKHAKGGVLQYSKLEMQIYFLSKVVKYNNFFLP